MLFDYQELERIIWLIPPSTYMREWRVRVGELVVFSTFNQKEAEALVKRLKDSVADALKAEIVGLTGIICPRCRTERPKKVKTDIGLRVYHYDNFLGWQPCDADFMWQALMRDKLERNI